MYKCEKCKRDIGNKGAYISHTKKCKLNEEILKIIIDDYLINGLSTNDLVRKYEFTKGIINSILKGRLRSFSEAGKIRSRLNPRKHSDESKAKMREARLKWMKENPEKTAWRQANMSYPEKLFKSKVEELELDKKYLIIRERSFFPYFIDFAFENEKVAIEIDGKQHELPERKESDQEKDDLLMKSDWRVYRIEAKQILERLDDVMMEVIKFIGDSKTFEKCGLITYREYKKDTKEKQKKDRKKREYPKNKKKEKKEKIDIQKVKNNGLTDKQIEDKLKSRKVERPPLEILLKEIEELGYVGVGRKYGVSDNAIRKWVKWYRKYGA